VLLFSKHVGLRCPAAASGGRWAWHWQMSVPNRLPAPKNFGWAAYSRTEIRMSALPPKADIETQLRDGRFVSKADSCSAKRFLRFGPKPSTSWLLAGNATSAFSQPLLSPLRSYATARCSARSSAASSPRAISETCSSSNWPNRDDGLSYSKVEPPFSFS